jgi:Domain of unknown function (DUF4349)
MTGRHIAIVVFATAALAGCASGASTALNSSSQVAPDGAFRQAPVAGPAVPANAAPANAAPAGATTTGVSAGQPANIILGTPSADIERSVSATYTVPPRTFLDSFEGVITRAVGLGGYVVSSSTQPDGSGRIVSGAVTLKIPAPKIADFLNGMPSSFVASAINFSSIDHTAQFVDVNARLASAHAHLAALDALLAKATSITDITNLEQQIESVQSEVDSDQGELNVLTASVALATATIEVSERGVKVAPVPPTNPVATGVGTGWDNAVRVTGAALEGVVSAVPLLVLLGLGLLVWRRVARTTPLRRRPGPAE